ncbi:hypothetical protein DFJ77DRAFT_439103 [Powellomyces hirtus]|nr:hypothetical protein DFJ77DRAFT_439103 [Powellomyces hirtus]
MVETFHLVISALLLSGYAWLGIEVLPAHVIVRLKSTMLYGLVFSVVIPSIIFSVGILSLIVHSVVVPSIIFSIVPRKRTCRAYLLSAISPSLKYSGLEQAVGKWLLDVTDDPRSRGFLGILFAGVNSSGTEANAISLPNIKLRYGALHAETEDAKDTLRADVGTTLHPLRTNPLERKNDTVLVNNGNSKAVRHARYEVARLLTVFSIKFHGVEKLLAYVQWFEKENDRNEAGMLTLKECSAQDDRAIIDVRTIERGCHLIPIWMNGLHAGKRSGRWLLNKHLDRWSYWELY